MKTNETLKVNDRIYTIYKIKETEKLYGMFSTYFPIRNEDGWIYLYNINDYKDLKEEKKKKEKEEEYQININRIIDNIKEVELEKTENNIPAFMNNLANLVIKYGDIRKKSYPNRTYQLLGAWEGVNIYGDRDILFVRNEDFVLYNMMNEIDKNICLLSPNRLRLKNGERFWFFADANQVKFYNEDMYLIIDYTFEFYEKLNNAVKNRLSEIKRETRKMIKERAKKELEQEMNKHEKELEKKKERQRQIIKEKLNILDEYYNKKNDIDSISKKYHATVKYIRKTVQLEFVDLTYAKNFKKKILNYNESVVLDIYYDLLYNTDITAEDVLKECVKRHMDDKFLVKQLIDSLFKTKKCTYIDILKRSEEIIFA